MRSEWLGRTLRILAAIALSGIAVDHLYEYYVDSYSAIPTIGTLFLLNAVGAIVLALAILTPVERLLPAPRSRGILGAIAACGIGLALTSLVALFISESTPLFGFMEYGYRTVVVLAIVAESAAIVLLSAFLVVHLRRHAVRTQLRAT